MAVVIVGGGAIGLLVAAQLTHTSQQVAVLARPSTVDALTTDNLRITQAGQPRVIDTVTVATEPRHLPPDYHHPELAILCVKGFDTAGAVQTLSDLSPAHVLTLQNGLGNEETLAAAFGEERVLSGIVTSSVALEGPAEITVTKTGGIGLAPMVAGKTGKDDGVERWRAVFETAGFTLRCYEDYRAMKWSKALLNILGNATSAILDMSVEEVYADPQLVVLERRAFLEGVGVMEKLNIRPLNLPSYPAALLTTAMRYLPFPLLHLTLRRAIAGGRGGKAPSLQRDLRQGQTQLEGDYLYGAMARMAEEVGVSAPVNTALTKTLNDIASGRTPWEEYRHRPQQLLKAVEGVSC